MFVTKKHRRFLMHCVGQHLQINIRQSYTARKFISGENVKDRNRTLYSQGLFLEIYSKYICFCVVNSLSAIFSNFFSLSHTVGLMLGFINHACASNAWPVDRDGDTIYIALRPILAGEQLSVNYYEFHWDITGCYGYKQQNHQYSSELCREPTKNEIESITSLPEFQFVSSQAVNLDEQTMDGKKFYMLKKMCANILRKFGRKIWCSQLKFVSDTYAKLLTVEFNGTLTVLKTSEKPTNNNKI